MHILQITILLLSIVFTNYFVDIFLILVLVVYLFLKKIFLWRQVNKYYLMME